MTEDGGENSVVRRDENCFAGLRGDGAARTAHAGVNHDHMNSICREIWVCIRKEKRALHNVLRRNVMCDIDDGGIGIDAENDAFHCANKNIGRAKIGGESDYAIHRN